MKHCCKICFAGLEHESVADSVVIRDARLHEPPEDDCFVTGLFGVGGGNFSILLGRIQAGVLGFREAE